MAWIESHQSLGRHPKTLRCALQLHIPVVAMVGHLHFLWWWTLEFAEDGDLSRFYDGEIASAAAWEGEAPIFVQALKDAGFLEQDKRLHDWEEYTGKLLDQRNLRRLSNRDAQRRRRERLRQQAVSPDINDRQQLHDDSQHSTVPNRTVPNRTIEKEKGAVHPPASQNTWDPPDWFLPLQELKGYKRRNHQKAAAVIVEACGEASVEPCDVVKLFAQEYPVLKAQYGWADPVAALRGRPLAICISQILNGGRDAGHQAVQGLEAADGRKGLHPEARPPSPSPFAKYS